MGDSAHPFLPTSVQGASQAIEDGVTIATVLKLAGSTTQVPTALLAYENIRCPHLIPILQTVFPSLYSPDSRLSVKTISAFLTLFFELRGNLI
jgi:2-polyprenyl-6-methoxyphenol hydroxylase-like FAD-dependent oxidoreductase